MNFILIATVCTVLAGGPVLPCDEYVQDGPMSLADCGRSIAAHANEQDVNAYTCEKVLGTVSPLGAGEIGRAHV